MHKTKNVSLLLNLTSWALACVCVCVLKFPTIDPIDDKYIPTYVYAYICMCFVHLYVHVRRTYSICAYMHMWAYVNICT